MGHRKQTLLGYSASRTVSCEWWCDSHIFHTCPMHWLPVREPIVLQLPVLNREAHRARPITYLAELLVNRVAPRLLRSASDTTQLVVPRTRNKRWTRAFSSAVVPVVWTSLPNCTRDCNSLQLISDRSWKHSCLINFPIPELSDLWTHAPT